jgi:hypothetical protein
MSPVPGAIFPESGKMTRKPRECRVFIDRLLNPRKGNLMSQQDYIPRPDSEFQDWAHNYYNYALANFAAWQIMSPQPTLEAPLSAFTIAYARYLDPNHGKVDTLEKRETRKTLETVCRQYYSAYINGNPQISDADRENLRVPVHSGARVPSTPPTTRPVADKIDTALRQITISFHDEGSLKKAKPKGVHECEIRWGLMETPPVNEEDFPHFDIDTRTPFTITVHENQRGQKVYFCLRWIGPTGLKGPWSEIYHAVAP